MSRILITGACGLLGNHLSRHLLDRGHEVIGIDNLSGGYREFMDPRVDFFELDLVNHEAVDDVFRLRQPEYVYHFAAYAAVGLSPFIRRFNYNNNVVASMNVINSCVNHNTKKIIFTSSMDVYGSAYAPPYTEELIPVPEDPYGIAKFAIEMDLKAAARTFGLRYSVVRPHNVFGVYQNIWDKYRNVLGIWIRQTLSGQDLTVYGDGGQIRSFSDVRFYMTPFETLMNTHDGETFNIGADTHTSIIDAATQFVDVARQRGYTPKIVHLEPRDEVRNAYCDHTKAKTLLGFQDGTDFPALLDDMLMWAAREPMRPVNKRTYEIDKNMYSFWK